MRLIAIDDSVSDYETIGWYRVPLTAFAQAEGETFPAIGR